MFTDLLPRSILETKRHGLETIELASLPCVKREFQLGAWCCANGGGVYREWSLMKISEDASSHKGRHVTGVSKLGKYRKVIKNWSYEC